MLTLFRRFLDTWAAKVFFFVLVAAFGLWGVADVVRNLGSSTSLAVVGSRKIELPEAQDAYRRQLAQVTKMFGTDIAPTPEIRRSVAGQALERLITSAALDNKVAEMGLAVPDQAVRQAVFDIPAFKNRNGVFDRPTFEGVLRNNGYTETRFLDLVRSDLGQKQILEAVRSSMSAPDVMADAVFAFQNEQRVADTVSLPFAAAAAPPPATETELQRYYDNNKSRYTEAEFRRIKAVILSPETVAADIPVSDAELAAAYAARRSEFNTPAKRSVQVLLAQDEATASRLADAWRGGADWTSIQKTASDAGASGVELADATLAEFPAPELGQAVFAAPLDQVPAVVHSALGWHVLKVTSITPATTRSQAEVTAQLRSKLVADKAADLVYTRADKVENALAAGTSLDDLPGDLGLAAVSGTLDAQGNTPEGRPAPIPGPQALRPALVQAVFQAKKGDTPHLVQAPNGADGEQSFYAFSVEEIIPPAVKLLDAVIETVRADWTKEAIRHSQDEAAAKLLAAVKGGQSLADAATVAGRRVDTLPPAGRATAVPGVPTQLITPLFGLKLGGPTMVETPDGFVVAVLSKIISTEAKADPAGFAQMRDALARSLADDAETLYAQAVRLRAEPKVNRAQVEAIAQAGPGPAGTE